MRQIPIRSLFVLVFFCAGMLGAHSNFNFAPLDPTLQQARKLGLAESVLEKAERNAQPALHLEHDSAERFSWIGGLPTVPAGFEWPYWRGQPLGFLAQLDLEEVAAAFKTSWLPPRGQLYFFFIDDERDAPGGYEPSDRGAWRVIYADVARSALAPASPPAAVDTLHFPKICVAFRPISTLPSEERLMARWDLSDAESEALFSARNAPFRMQPRHQLFGLPWPEQTDDMELTAQLAANDLHLDFGRASRDPHQLAEAARWHLLLQIDTDDAAQMMWGDAGLLYFWIRDEDAARRNFDAVWMILQSG